MLYKVHTLVITQNTRDIRLSLVLTASFVVISKVLGKSSESPGPGPPCLSPLPSPIDGSFHVSGSFRLSIICPDDKDIPGNAPGEPPGILYCNPKLGNDQEVMDLKLPQCLVTTLPPPSDIEMEVKLTFVFSTQAQCENFSRNQTLHKTFEEEVMPTIKLKCPSCSTRDRPNESCFQSGNKHIFVACLGVAKRFNDKVGLPPMIIDISSSRALDEDMSIWGNITHIVENSSSVLNPSGTQLVDIHFTHWRAACEGVPHSIGTTLYLHGRVKCLGCSGSFYLDPKRKDRCLRCPWGKWTYKDSITAGHAQYNSLSDCVRCPSRQLAAVRHKMSEEKWKKLCYPRE